MASGNWRMVDPPRELVEYWRDNWPPGVDPPRSYTHPSGLTALVGREPLADEDWRWHISVRFGERHRNGRIPTWGELVMTAHELRPGVVFVIGVPPRSWWMNVHPDVLHLYETHDDPLIDQYRVNAADQAPTS
jgi:hypothetical protein